MYRYQFVTDKKFKSKTIRYTVRSKIWVYPGMAAWRFLTVPVLKSKLIKKQFGHSARGWGSLPVQVTVGKTSWKTSIFPDKKLGAYILPLKSQVREKENLKKGDVIQFSLQFN